MMRATLRRAALVLLLMASPAVSEPGVLIVVHAQHPSPAITRGMLVDVYMKKVRVWEDGTPVLPVDQSLTSPTRVSFSKEALRQSLLAVESYWNQQIFAGRGVPPPVRRNDEEVLAFVEAYRGAIGYVAENAPVGARRLRVLSVID